MTESRAPLPTAFRVQAYPSSTCTVHILSPSRPAGDKPMLPESLKVPFQDHLKKVKTIHVKDLHKSGDTILVFKNNVYAVPVFSMIYTHVLNRGPAVVRSPGDAL